MPEAPEPVYLSPAGKGLFLPPGRLSAAGEGWARRGGTQPVSISLPDRKVGYPLERPFLPGLCAER